MDDQNGDLDRPATRGVIVLAGPTASGKSALALSLAETLGSRGVAAVLINADSMQVYRELRTLTARPTPADEARVPHRLYGVMSAAEACSAERWRRLALDAIKAATDAGQTPILVGGTGLYIRALLDGMAPVPEVPEAVRTAARAKFDELGGPAFHAALAARDPAGSAAIATGDRQRLLRAWEVLEATGKPLRDWQNAGQEGLARPALKILLEVDREALYRRCDARFDAMIAAGALDEVRALIPAGIDPTLPAMKALGVPALMTHLAGDMDLEQAGQAAKQATRNYAKRQLTWFRHQYQPDARISAGPDALEACFEAVEGFLLTQAGTGSRSRPL